MTSPLLPQITACEQLSPQQLRLTLLIKPELSYFSGHFPGLPLLPGVVQVDWAVRFASEHLGVSGDFLSLDNLKFQGMIFPGRALHLTLEWQAASGRLSFSYNDVAGNKLYSSGRISFSTPVHA